MPGARWCQHGGCAQGLQHGTALRWRSCPGLSGGRPGTQGLTRHNRSRPSTTARRQAVQAEASGVRFYSTVPCPRFTACQASSTAHPHPMLTDATRQRLACNLSIRPAALCAEGGEGMSAALRAVGLNSLDPAPLNPASRCLVLNERAIEYINKADRGNINTYYHDKRKGLT